jgi:DNA-binding beta-propeller fold protein YncE
MAALWASSAQAVILNGENAKNVLGQGGSYTTATTNCTATGMAYPTNVEVDRINHHLFVTDSGSSGHTGNNRVLVFNLNADNSLTGATANYVLGQSSMTVCTANTGGISATSLSAPQGISYDPVHNRLFVADSGNNRVLVYLMSGLATGMAATYYLGQTSFTGSPTGSGAAALNGTHGVLYDGSGSNDRLFVSDYNNNRVQVFDFKVTPLASGNSANYSLGSTSTGSAGGGGCTAAQMLNPQNMSFDPQRQLLYVAENNNNRVSVYNLTGGITTGMSASYVLGSTSLSTCGGSCANGHLTAVKGVYLDYTNDRVLVADSGNTSGYGNRVLAFNIPNNNSSTITGMLATNVLGQTSFTSCNYNQTGTATPTQSSLYAPYNLVLMNGDLYVADELNNRVMVFDANFVNSSFFQMQQP